MPRLPLAAFGLSLLLGLAACSGDGGPADVADVAVDAAPDAVPDVADDAISDADIDAAPDAPADAVPDAPVDAESDAAVDAVSDASDVSDGADAETVGDVIDNGDAAPDVADAPTEVTGDAAGDAPDAATDADSAGDAPPDPCPGPVGEVADQWLRHLVAGESLDRGNGLALLADGGFMLTGAAFNNPGATATLDPDGPCPAALAGDPSGFFLSRHHPDGSLAWVRNGVGIGSPDDLALLSGGGVVVMGRFQGTIALGVGAASAVSLDSEGKQDIFVARYDDGALSWAFGLGGDDNDLALSVEPLSDGGFAIAGEYEATVTFGPGEGQTLTTTAFRSAFIARYSGAGALVWVRAATGPGWSTITDLAVGPDERLAFVGHFDQDIGWAMGDGTPGSLDLVSQGGLDAMFGALSADGALLWADSAGSVRPPGTPDGIPGYEERGDAIAAAADGTSYVAAEFSRQVTLGAGLPTEVSLGDDADWPNDKLWLAAYDPTGALLWARQTTASASLDADWHTAKALVPLPGGGLVMGGSFVSDITLGTGETAQTTLGSEGNFDHFLARFDSAGALLWARRGGGAEADYLNRVVLDPSPTRPALLVLGLFQDAADMDFFAPPGLPAQSSELTALGFQDVFVGRVALTAP